MILKSLNLTNFGSIRSAKISFDNPKSPAIYVFNGENGSGKSTIVKALSLLLINYSKGKLGDYINWDSTFFEISCEFHHLGKDFFSYLKYDGGSKRILRITQEGKESEEYFNSDATEHLKSYFDPKIFRSSAFSFEGEVDVIEVGPAERREHLKKIHDVEFKEEISNAEKSLKLLKDQLAAFESELAVLESKSYSFLEIPALPFSEDDFLEKKKLLQTTDSLLQQSLVINNEIEKKQAEAVNISASIPKVNEQIAQNDCEKSSLLSKEVELTQKRAEAEIALKTASERIEKKYENEKATLEKSKEDLQAQLDSLRLVRLPTPPASDAIEKLVSRISSFRTSEGVEKISLESLECGICPVCKKPVDPQELVAAQARLKSLEEERSATELDLESARKTKKEYEELSKKNEETKTKQASLTQEIKLCDTNISSLVDKQAAELKSEKERIEAEIRLIDSKLEGTKTQWNSLKTLSESTLENKKNLESRLADIQKFLLTARKVDVSQQQADKRALEEEISNYNSVLGTIASTKKQNEETQKLKDLDSAEILRIKVKKDDQLHLVSVQERAAEILKRDLPAFIISHLIVAITDSMNDFLLKTYKGRYKVKVLESKNSLDLVYGPKSADVSLSSGYERQVISSAYKYAKEQMLGLGFLILDEVDSAASSKNSEVFYKTLGELPYRQLLVITHKPTTKDLLSQDYGASIFYCENGNIQS